MEFVNKLKTGKDINSIYAQNNDIDIPCKFENRDTSPLDINAIDYTVDKKYTDNYTYNTRSYNNYSNNFNVNKVSDNIPLRSKLNIKNKDNHYQLLVNTNNITKDTSLINITDKYKEGENQVNFERKNYIEGGEDYNLLLTNNNYVKGESVTNNSTYEDSDFWKKQQPNIQLGEYMFRDSARSFYNNEYKEGYISGEYPMGKFANKKKNPYIIRNLIDNSSEPKVSSNYVTNYTTVDNKIIHEGNKKKNNSNSYVKRMDTYMKEDIKGNNLYYYNDDIVDKFNDNFKDVNLKLNEYMNMNGGMYRQFENTNKKYEDLTNYERNIMINRNDKLLAGLNNVSRYDYYI